MEHTFYSSRYDIRPATVADVPAMVELYYQSFYPSHPFWPILMPRTPSVDEWWVGTFKLGIKNPKCRTFLVIDHAPHKGTVPPNQGTDTESANDGVVVNEHGHRAVAWSRWWIPEQNWKHTEWPAPPADMYPAFAGPFFGGMEHNREELLKGTAHWFFELLGVAKGYWGRGLGSALLRWGCEEADGEGLQVYLGASPMGSRLYTKHFGFVKKADVPMPDEADLPYGSYVRLAGKA